jgi:hypothetical protein
MRSVNPDRDAAVARCAIHAQPSGASNRDGRVFETADESIPGGMIAQIQGLSGLCQDASIRTRRLPHRVRLAAPSRACSSGSGTAFAGRCQLAALYLLPLAATLLPAACDCSLDTGTLPVPDINDPAAIVVLITTWPNSNAPGSPLPPGEGQRHHGIMNRL